RRAGVADGIGRHAAAGVARALVAAAAGQHGIEPERVVHRPHERVREELAALHRRHVRLELAREVGAEGVAQQAFGVVELELHRGSCLRSPAVVVPAGIRVRCRVEPGDAAGRLLERDRVFVALWTALWQAAVDDRAIFGMGAGKVAVPPERLRIDEPVGDAAIEGRRPPASRMRARPAATSPPAYRGTRSSIAVSPRVAGPSPKSWPAGMPPRARRNSSMSWLGKRRFNGFQLPLASMPRELAYQRWQPRCCGSTSRHRVVSASTTFKRACHSAAPRLESLKPASASSTRA